MHTEWFDYALWVYGSFMKDFSLYSGCISLVPPPCGSGVKVFDSIKWIWLSDLMPLNFLVLFILLFSLLLSTTHEVVSIVERREILRIGKDIRGPLLFCDYDDEENHIGQAEMFSDKKGLMRPREMPQLEKAVVVVLLFIGRSIPAFFSPRDSDRPLHPFPHLRQICFYR